MLKKIGIALFLVFVAFITLVSAQPSDFKVERSLFMQAPVARIYEQVNTHRNWVAWSPWAELDPNMKATFEGPESGVGSVHSWSGNNEVGEGKSTITESVPNERIQMRLDFVRPMESTSTVEFAFNPEPQGTLVTWSMWGKNNFIGKAFGLVMDCDQMVGEQFEKGLNQLKSVVEAPAP